MKPLEIVKQMSLNQKLAAVLLVLAFIAVLAGNPYTGAHTSMDAQELALIVDRQVDHVSAEELADWIIQNKADYRLVDLRTVKEYNEYNIPGSENIPLSQLTLSDLLRNEKIVLYSEGGIHSAQAWFLLKAKGYKSVYMLFGGLDEWKEKILFPIVPANATAEQLLQFEKIKEISKFFGGTPQTGSAQATSTQTVLPTLTLPAGTGKAEKPAGKKKKEGC
jgi:rhodanese-related sulfurtransferase